MSTNCRAQGIRSKIGQYARHLMCLFKFFRNVVWSSSKLLVNPHNNTYSRYISFVLHFPPVFSIPSGFSQTIASAMSRREFHFTASFIHISIADPSFYTFARDPYETCRGHPDEKVEKRVQVAKIYGETGNT